MVGVRMPMLAADSDIEAPSAAAICGLVAEAATAAALATMASGLGSVQTT